VYVEPTEDMQILPSEYVNSGGVVFHPTLSDWKHVSSLLSFKVFLFSMCVTSLPIQYCL